MSEWQPIETAPKDGTMVRIYYDDGVQDDRYWNNGWCRDVGWPVAYNYRFFKATHWMPIPPPPTSKGEGDE